MLRIIACLALVVILAGCRMPIREEMKRLPDNAPPLSFTEMIDRARVQAGLALDAFYIDSWFELEASAQSLEQSARLLPKSLQIPEALRTRVGAEADALREDAVKLAESARAKNPTQANEAMQRINFRIRQLKLDDRTPPEKLPSLK